MNDGEIVYEEGWHIISKKQNLCAFYCTKTLQETEKYFVGVRIKNSHPGEDLCPPFSPTYLVNCPAILLDHLSM